MSRARDVADTQDNVGGAVAPYVAGKNSCINGGMDIWQRGTSFTAASVYTADRWFSDGGTGRTFSQVTTSDTTNLPNIAYALRMQRNSGQTWTGAYGVITSFENMNSQPLIGQTVTLSFWARAGANFSATSNAFAVKLYAGTGTNQRRDFSAAFTGETQPISTSATLTTAWQRFTYTGTVGSTMTQVAIGLYYSTTGTAGAADYADITGVQLEIGSIATPFSRAGGSIGGELALCQRYYQRWAWSSNSDHLGNGQGSGGAQTRRANWATATTMRTAPSLSFTGAITMYDGTPNARNISALGYAAGTTTNRISVDMNTAQGNLNLGDFIFIIMTSGSYFEASSEL